MDRYPLIGRGRTAEIYAWEPGKVLKLYLDWCPVEWADHEARFTKAVFDSGLPAPEVYDRVDLDGRHGLIMERIEGHSLIEEIKRRPWKVTAAGRLLGELHAAMHSRTIASLSSGMEGLRRSIGTMEGLEEGTRQKVLAYLETLPDGDALCHGDFHPENVMLSPRGPVILDWAFPTRSNPLADAARTVLLLTIGEPVKINPFFKAALQLVRGVVYRAYLSTYQRLRSVRPGEVEAWILPLAVGRLREDIPGEKEKLLRLIQARLDFVHP